MNRFHRQMLLVLAKSLSTKQLTKILRRDGFSDSEIETFIQTIQELDYAS